MAWNERHHCLPSGRKGGGVAIFLILPKAQTLEGGGGEEKMLTLVRSLFWKISNSPAPLFIEQRLTNRVWAQPVFCGTRGNIIYPIKVFIF